jgi:hypothetical protein
MIHDRKNMIGIANGNITCKQAFQRYPAGSLVEQNAIDEDQIGLASRGTDPMTVPNLIEYSPLQDALT